MGDTNISVQLSTNAVGEVVGINLLGGLFVDVEPAELNGVTGITFQTDDVAGVIAGFEVAIEQLRGIGAAKI